MSTRKPVDALYGRCMQRPCRLGYRLNRGFNYLTMLEITYQDSGYIVAWRKHHKLLCLSPIIAQSMQLYQCI